METRRRFALLNAASMGIGSTLDLGQTARETVNVTVPRFADAAGIYVLNRLLESDELPVDEAETSIVVRRLACGGASAYPAEWARAFPADEVVVYPADTPYARCVATGKPVLFNTLDAQTAERIKAYAGNQPSVSHLLNYTSFLATPLKARGTVLGFVALARRPGNHPLDQTDVTLAEEITARAAVCIDNARRYTQERHTALALRKSLLPETTSLPSGIEIAHRYRAASGIRQVGGDWYDVISLADDRVALVIGDVMGHDATATSAMVQFRTAARTLANLDLPPAEVLHWLDHLAQDLDVAQFATCIYATCNPDAGIWAIANAGHIPPILAHAHGDAEVLNLPAGLPLGVGGATFETTVIEVSDGATLALCTDGLVESRTRDIDTGIAALRNALTQPRSSLQQTCDTVIETLCHSGNNDDVTLLLARRRILHPG